MPRDLDGLADVVVLTVKTALAPVLERLALAEQQHKTLEGRLLELTGLRDRLVTVETKAAEPRHPEPVAVDLAPVLERLSATEAYLKALGDVRDRVLVMETKVESGPVRSVPIQLETHDGPSVAEIELSIAKAIAPISERVAVMESRAHVPGPAGINGQDGKDGPPGKDGADGLGFDDIAVDFDGDRTLAVKFVRGDHVKTFPIALPFQRQQGVYLEGKSYTVGDVVTWGGSQWHCNEDTSTKPGDVSKVWTLIVKRGRDGKDGRDGHDAVMPVVKLSCLS